MSLQRQLKAIPQLSQALWVLGALIFMLLGKPHHAVPLGLGALCCSGLIWWRRQWGLWIYLSFLSALFGVMSVTEGAAGTASWIFWKVWGVLMMVAALGLIAHALEDE